MMMMIRTSTLVPRYYEEPLSTVQIMLNVELIINMILLQIQYLTRAKEVLRVEHQNQILYYNLLCLLDNKMHYTTGAFSYQILWRLVSCVYNSGHI